MVTVYIRQLCYVWGSHGHVTFSDGKKLWFRGHIGILQDA